MCVVTCRVKWKKAEEQEKGEERTEEGGNRRVRQCRVKETLKRERKRKMERGEGVRTCGMEVHEKGKEEEQEKAEEEDGG